MDTPETEPVTQMGALIGELAKALVDDPQRVRVETELFEAETLVRLYVASEDLSKITGKQGRTVRSLRTILGAAAAKTQQRFSLDVQPDA